jgi:hypothetical protein
MLDEDEVKECSQQASRRFVLPRLQLIDLQEQQNSTPGDCAEAATC